MSIGVDPDCVELARKFLADSARFLAEEKLVEAPHAAGEPK